MNLKCLSNTDLDQSLHHWIKAEKRALNIIISHIAEVDLRKLYLDYAYPNLRAYLEERMGYDGGSAQRRIDAARLSQAVPDLAECLQTGSLKLSQVSVLQKALRETQEVPLSNEEKIELVEAIKNRSVNETQVIVAKALNIEIKQSPRITYQADESVRLDLTLSKSQWEKLGRMRELLSNTLPSENWAEVFEYLADRVIRQKTGGVRAAACKVRNPLGSSLEIHRDSVLDRRQDKTLKKSLCNRLDSQLDSQLNNHLDNYEKNPKSLYQLKKLMLAKTEHCEFKSRDGKVCGSRWGLEVDHVQPKWAGGEDTVVNLRVLCGNHNRHMYRKQANIQKVQR